MVDQVGTFYGNFGSIGGFFFDTRNGLFVVFSRQNGVGDRDVVVKGNAADTCAGLIGYQFKVVGFATNDNADGNQGIELFG